MDFIRSKRQRSDDYIGGYGKLTNPARRMMAVAAIASRVVDPVLRIVTGDDRWPRVLPEMDAEIRTQLARLEGFPMDILDSVARLVGRGSQGLRAKYCQAAFVAAGTCGIATEMLCGAPRARAVG